MPTTGALVPPPGLIPELWEGAGPPPEEPGTARQGAESRVRGHEVLHAHQVGGLGGPASGAPSQVPGCPRRPACPYFPGMRVGLGKGPRPGSRRTVGVCPLGYLVTPRRKGRAGQLGTLCSHRGSGTRAPGGLGPKQRPARSGLGPHGRSGVTAASDPFPVRQQVGEQVQADEQQRAGAHRAREPAGGPGPALTGCHQAPGRQAGRYGTDRLARLPPEGPAASGVPTEGAWEVCFLPTGVPPREDLPLLSSGGTRSPPGGIPPSASHHRPL